MTEYSVRYLRVGQPVAAPVDRSNGNPVKNADPLEVMLPIINNVQLLRPC